MEMAPRHALIFIGGNSPESSVRDQLPQPGVVIAADSGWTHAVALGFQPDFLIGDMDSIRPEDLVDAHASDTEIIEYPADKDFTDTELALQLARKFDYRHIHLVSGGGDRFDHLLAMVHSLVKHADDATMSAHVGDNYVHIVTPREAAHLELAIGSTVSLIPLGGNAKGVTTTGLQWELKRDTLHSFASRGVSNIATSSEVRISLRTGALAVISTINKGNEPS
jgi:thiamine pyrophosphokinase